MGGGSWGTTFAMVLADAGNDVMLWARDPAVASSVATTTRTRPSTRASRCRARSARPASRRGARRRGPRRARGAVADAAGQPRRVGPAAAARRSAGVADEGRRAGHDERMTEVASRSRPSARSGSPSCRARTWRARSRSASPPHRRGVHRRASRSWLAEPARRRTSGRTRTTDVVGTSSAARSRTSSRWPTASSSGSGWARTRRPRSSPGASPR